MTQLGIRFKKKHEASKQFNDSNPNHNIPNILIFINHDSFTAVGDLWYVLTGNVWPGTDGFDFRYLNRLKKKNDLTTTDYFIWIDKCINKIYYINYSPAFKESFKSKISSKVIAIEYSSV